MIFYDEHKQRKHYVRIGIILLLGAFIALSVDTAYGVYNKSARQAIDPSTIYYAYEHYYSNSESEKKIALTFDDGPHPTHTRAIADILKEEGVPATFFFTGSNVVKYEDIVAYVDDAGFEIGNHTYTHAESVHASRERLLWELSVTSTLIEDITGEPVLLYRPPFLLDIGTDPTANPYVAQKAPLTWSMEGGYIPVGADIDPKDWSADNPEDVVSRVGAELAENPEGQIVLLHDGGENANRGVTVEALPELIDSFREKGYTFTTVGDILGFASGSIQPQPEYAGTRYGALNSIFLSSVLSVDSVFRGLFLVVLALVILRIFGFIILYFVRKVRKKEAPPAYTGLVSVVVPAYNEAANIDSTLESVVANDYAKKEIIVVDDGSTDRTSEVVKGVQERFPGQIQLIKTANGGKAHALAIGFSNARGEVVVALDGDTIFAPDTVGKLARHFNDTSVGAVAGKVMVGNTRGLLAAFQGIEYIVGQNIERQMLSVIGAVNVVPGAVGAWRKGAVSRAGGHETDTLVEDQDLTLSVLRDGWHVVYEPEAIAHTEVPHTTQDFIRQRFRWTFGTMQCFWKYRRNFFDAREPELGLIILPKTLVYNVIVPLLSPIIDILVIVGLIVGFSQYILAALVFFTLFDLLYASVAFVGERGKRHLLWILPLQRIYYRLAIYFVVVRGIVIAIEGTRVGWGKVEKRGVMKLFYNKRFMKSGYPSPQTETVPEAV